MSFCFVFILSYPKEECFVLSSCYCSFCRHKIVETLVSCFVSIFVYSLFIFTIKVLLQPIF